MYHLASGWTVVVVPASLIALARCTNQQFLAILKNKIDREEEHHGQTHHDENHHRGEVRFPERRPGHLVDALAAHFAEELEEAAAGARSRRRQFLAAGSCIHRLLRRIGHSLLSLCSTGRSGGTRTHGLRFWRPP